MSDEKKIPSTQLMGAVANALGKKLPVDDNKIHTMAMDIENLTPPATKKIETAEKEPIFTTSPSFAEIKTETPRTDPVLAKVVNQKSNPHNFWSKIITIALFVSIFAVIAEAGYYYWVSKQKQEIKNTEVTAPATPTSNPPEQPEVPENTSLSFSIDKPNYLHINSTQTSTDIKTLLSDAAKKVQASKMSTPIEYIITDESNNPVNFKTFASQLGLKFPDTIMANLSEPYSLFIFNDAELTRLGISISSKNDALLKKALLKEEPILDKELEALYLDASYTPNNKAFSDSTYAGATVRFKNITSPEVLSNDYSIYKQHLLIGTTKMTLRAVIDTLNKN